MNIIKWGKHLSFGFHLGKAPLILHVVLNYDKTRESKSGSEMVVLFRRCEVSSVSDVKCA